MQVHYEVALWKLAAALGFGIVLAAMAAFTVLRLAEARMGRSFFRAVFLILICVYALGFVARYALIEVMP
jgi:hypothetical protein